MIKIIKRIGYGLMVLFLLAIAFLLVAIKCNWDIGSGFISVFLILLVLTLAFITIVSAANILEYIRKDRKKFVKAFFLRWVSFFLVACAAAFFKKDVDMPMLLGTTIASAALSFGYAPNVFKN